MDSFDRGVQPDPEVRALMRDALKAEENFTLDELEDFAEKSRVCMFCGKGGGELKCMEGTTKYYHDTCRDEYETLSETMKG